MSEAIPYILVGIILYALYNSLLTSNFSWNKQEIKWRVISTFIEISIPFVVCAFLFTHTEKGLTIAVIVSVSLYCLSENFFNKKAYDRRMKYMQRMISAYDKSDNPEERNNIKREISSLKHELKHAL